MQTHHLFFHQTTSPEKSSTLQGHKSILLQFTEHSKVKFNNYYLNVWVQKLYMVTTTKYKDAIRNLYLTLIIKYSFHQIKITISGYFQ
jgi:hypothetical protein